MPDYKFGCCIPGASFMPEGVSHVNDETLREIREGTRAIIDAGFDFAEIGVGMVMRLSDEDFDRCVSDLLPIRAANSFIPFHFHIVSDGAVDNGSPLVEYLEKALYRMSRLGVKVVVFGSGGARRIPEGMERADGHEYIKKFLRIAGDIAAKNGVMIAIEPLRECECNAINYSFEGEKLAKDVSHPSIAYLADAFHMAEGGEPADSLESAETLPIHIHISEAPDRTRPGCHGGEYLSEFAASLKRTAYDGMISVECGFKDFKAELPVALEFVKRNFK